MSIKFESVQRIEAVKNRIENATGLKHENLTEAIQALKDMKPISISSAEDLLHFSNEVNAGRSNLCAVLTDDIDMSATKWIEDMSSHAIGTSDTPYCGTFDGQGHTISGIEMSFNNVFDKVEDKYRDFRVGLFGTVNGATIRNITVSGSATITGRHCENSKIGGICAVAKNSTFVRCCNKVSINSPLNTNPGAYQHLFYTNIGGIIGYAKSVVVHECSNEADMYISGMYVGGLIGYMEDSDVPSKVTCSCNKGRIDGYDITGCLIGRLGGCTHRYKDTGDIVEIDFSASVSGMSNQDWWNDLAPTSDENVKYVGCKDGNTAMTTEQIAAYDSLNEYLKLNHNWWIDETVSGFKRKEFRKRLFFNNNPEYQWRVGYYPYMTYTNNSVNANRADLCLKVVVPEDGRYQLVIDLYAESSTGNSNIITGGNAGGGCADIYVDGELLYKDYIFRGTSSQRKEDYIRGISLKKGISTISIEHSDPSYGSRPTIMLNSIKLIQANDIEVISGKTIEFEAKGILENAGSSIDDIDIISNNDFIDVSMRTDNDTYCNITYRSGRAENAWIRLYDRNKSEYLVDLFATAVGDIDTSTRTTIVNNCYNTGNYGSHSLDGTSRWHSAGLFGETQIESFYVHNCFTAGAADYIERNIDTNEDGIIDENDFYAGSAIYVTCRSTSVGSYNNVAYLRGVSRKPFNIQADDHYEDVAIDVEHEHMCGLDFAEIFGFVYTGNLPMLDWEISVYDDLISRSSFNMSSNSLGEIAPYAFYRNTSLLYVDFPRVRTIGGAAFFGCKNLYSINSPLVEFIDVGEGDYGYEGAFEWSNIESTPFPLLNVVADRCFARCSSLKVADLPSATHIGECAFMDCKSLSSIHAENVSKVGYSAFNGCVDLKEVYLPGVVELEGSAFYGCTNLQSVKLSPAIEELPGAVFSKCSSLTNFDFSNIKKFLGSSTFSQSGLTSVVCTKLQTVTTSSFWKCEFLTKADFHVATKIEGNSFNYTPLDALILRSDTVCALASTTAFASSSLTTTGYIYVPKALLSEYKSATNWSTLSKRFRAIEDYQDICGGV